MDDKGLQRQGAVNRSRVVVFVLSALLLVSVGWNIWHYRLEQKRRANTIAEERISQAAIALANEQAARARLTKRARDAQAGVRVQQLYNEINHLTSVGEEISLPSRKVDRTPITNVEDKPAADP